MQLNPLLQDIVNTVSGTVPATFIILLAYRDNNQRIFSIFEDPTFEISPKKKAPIYKHGNAIPTYSAQARDHCITGNEYTGSKQLAPAFLLAQTRHDVLGNGQPAIQSRRIWYGHFLHPSGGGAVPEYDDAVDDRIPGRNS